MSARSPAGAAGRATDPGWRAQSSRSCAPANLRTNSGTKERIRAWMKRSATRCTSQSTTAEPRRGSYCSCRDPATRLRSPASWACGRSEADAREGRSGPERSLGVISSASHTPPCLVGGRRSASACGGYPTTGATTKGPASPLAGHPPVSRPDHPRDLDAHPEPTSSPPRGHGPGLPDADRLQLPALGIRTCPIGAEFHRPTCSSAGPDTATKRRAIGKQEQLRRDHQAGPEPVYPWGTRWGCPPGRGQQEPVDGPDTRQAPLVTDRTCQSGTVRACPIQASTS